MNKNLRLQTLNLKFKDKNNGLVVELNETTDSSELLNVIAAELSEKSSIIELSASGCSDKLFLEFAKNVKQLCEMFGSVLIIKNRSDIAYLASADCLVIDEKGIDISYAKELIGNDILLSLELIPDSMSMRKNTNQKIKNCVDYITIAEALPLKKRSLSTELSCMERDNNTLCPILIKENLTSVKYFNTVYFKLIMPLVD